jgi:hypothetical protein
LRKTKGNGLDPRKGIPAQAFIITNRPDELLRLAIDALERKKYLKITMDCNSAA